MDAVFFLRSNPGRDESQVLACLVAAGAEGGIGEGGRVAVACCAGGSRAGRGVEVLSATSRLKTLVHHLYFLGAAGRVLGSLI